MKILIDYNPTDDMYYWKLWDGPEDIDEYEGVELDMGQCFEQIIINRTINALQYK